MESSLDQSDSMLKILNCKKHNSKIVRICSVKTCRLKLACIICRNEHSKTGHLVIDIHHISNSKKIEKSTRKICLLYEHFIEHLKKSFFAIWLVFDRQMLRNVRQFEKRMNWGRDTSDNPRFLGAKYGLDAQFKMKLGTQTSKLESIFDIFG